MSDTANLYQKTFDVLHQGSIQLPIAAGSYSTIRMPDDFQQGSFFIAFYNSAGVLTAPTAGSITIELSPIEGQWHGLAQNGTIMANTVGAQATYIVPTFCTLVRWARINFDANIAAAGTGGYANAFFWRGITA